MKFYIGILMSKQDNTDSFEVQLWKTLKKELKASGQFFYIDFFEKLKQFDLSNKKQRLRHLEHNRYFISDQLLMVKKAISVRNRMYRALLKTGSQRENDKSRKIEYCLK